MKKHVLFAIAGLLLLTGAATASTFDIASHRRVDFFAPGTHQFYMWCAEGQDRVLWQKGMSATDAMARLNEDKGCRLSWQGRIPS